jgi:hypothetical protein
MVSFLKKKLNSRIMLFAKCLAISLIFFTGCPYEDPAPFPNVTTIGLGRIPFEVVTQNVSANSDAYITFVYL